MTTRRTPAAPARGARRLLERLVAVAIGLLLAELGVRALLAAEAEAYDAAEVRAQAELVLAAELERPPAVPPAFGLFADPQVPHPFVGFDTVAANAEFEAQLAALRAEPAALDRYFVVLVVGGSVAQYFGDPVNGGLEPLRRRLAEDPRRQGRELLFLGHGRAAYKQPQQLFWFLWLLTTGFEPDLVINVDGFNEVAIAAHNRELGVHPLYPMGLRWATSIASSRTPAVLEQAAEGLRLRDMWRRVLRYRLERSAILGTLARARHAGFERARRRAEERALAELGEAGLSPLFGPEFAGDEDDALRLAVDAWGEGSRSLHAVCAARGIRYLHVLQPTLHDEGSKPLTDEERESGALPPSAEAGVRRGYLLLRAAGERLAADGVPFLDASRVFADVHETIYFDGCHFVRPGTVLLGEAVAAAL